MNKETHSEVQHKRETYNSKLNRHCSDKPTPHQLKSVAIQQQQVSNPAQLLSRLTPSLHQKTSKSVLICRHKNHLFQSVSTTLYNISNFQRKIKRHRKGKKYILRKDKIIIKTKFRYDKNFRTTWEEI